MEKSIGECNQVSTRRAASRKSRKFTYAGVKLYEVRYVLDNRDVRDVNDTMKAWVAPVDRPTRSTQSSQQGQLLL